MQRKNTPHQGRILRIRIIADVLVYRRAAKPEELQTLNQYQRFSLTSILSILRLQSSEVSSLTLNNLASTKTMHEDFKNLLRKERVE